MQIGDGWKEVDPADWVLRSDDDQRASTWKVLEDIEAERFRRQAYPAPVAQALRVLTSHMRGEREGDRP